jgi:hypothetical protein
MAQASDENLYGDIGGREMSRMTLRDWRNELKQFGINSADMARQNNMSRQWFSLIFKNYSPMYLSLQLFTLDKAIDEKIGELKRDIVRLEDIKRLCRNYVDDAVMCNYVSEQEDVK